MLLVYVACPDADIYHMKRSRFELVPKVICKNGRFWIFRTLVMIEKSVSTVIVVCVCMIVML